MIKAGIKASRYIPQKRDGTQNSAFLPSDTVSLRHGLSPHSGLKIPLSLRDLLVFLLCLGSQRADEIALGKMRYGFAGFGKGSRHFRRGVNP
jgi:hypothetical protein